MESEVVLSVPGGSVIAKQVRHNRIRVSLHAKLVNKIMSDIQGSHLQFYRQEDIQQILQLAIARQASSDELTYDQLVEIAEELGISSENLQLAQQDWLQQKRELVTRQQFNLHRRSKLNKKIGRYAIANTVFLTLNWLSAGTLSWALYLALLWGLALGLEVWNTYHLNEIEYEQAFQNWYRQYQFKQSVTTLWDKFNRVLQG